MEKLLRNLSNIPGWRTKKKLVVIESDDWGSIRMPSKEVFASLVNKGIDLNSDIGNRYNKYDSLATKTDLEALFELLSSIKDSTGSSIVITPISIVANPDFNQIEASGFSNYFYEPFTETLKKYPNCENSFRLWQYGIKNRLFVPQFHGREHLNVNIWMRALQSGHKNTLLAFNHRMWGISTIDDPNIKLEYQAAFDFKDPRDILSHKDYLSSGLKLFQELFGYTATCFVPPNGPFSSLLEEECVNGGIQFLSTSKIQVEPKGNGKTVKRLHWLGQKKKSGLTIYTRNCFFEPSDKRIDWIDSCLNEINTAFRWGKPAIISSHRVNYIGSLDRENRNYGLKQLARLLKSIMMKWPDAVFVSSGELVQIIENE